MKQGKKVNLIPVGEFSAQASIRYVHDGGAISETGGLLQIVILLLCLQHGKLLTKRYNCITI